MQRSIRKLEAPIESLLSLLKEQALNGRLCSADSTLYCDSVASTALHAEHMLTTRSYLSWSWANVIILGSILLITSPWTKELVTLCQELLSIAV